MNTDIMADIRAIDEYLADEDKELGGQQPEWILESGYGEWQVTWPIRENQTGVVRSSLKFRIPIGKFHYPSIGLIFRGEMVQRLDRVPASERKTNPWWAENKGLPLYISGTHIHAWADNRNHIASRGRWGALPARRPIKANMTRLQQMFFWFCDEINVRIQRDNRQLALPDRSLL